MKRILRIMVLTFATSALLIIGASVVSATEIVAQGTCGDNVTWVLDDEGTLLITGNGDMSNYYAASSDDFRAYRDQVKSIVVNEGITKIGEYAFCKFKNVETVVFPNSLVQCEAFCLNECPKLTDITLPFVGETPEAAWSLSHEERFKQVFLYIFGMGEGSTTTEVYVPGALFTHYYPKSLKHVTVTNSTSVNLSAFNGCYGIESIQYSKNISEVMDYAFENCRELKSFDLKTCESIGKNAFRSSGIKSITIPETVNNIGESAFWDCPNLEHISVAEDNTTFDSRDDCNALIKTSDNEVLLGCANTTFPSTVKRIAEYAFTGNSKLEEIVIPDTIIGVGDDVFYGCKNLKQVTISKNIVSLGYYFFYGCPKLETVIFNGDIDIIGHGVFDSGATIKIIAKGNGPYSVNTDAPCAKLTIQYYTEFQDGWSDEVKNRFPNGTVFIMTCINHLWNSEYSVDETPTCTEDGAESIHCSVCTATKDERIIPASHKWNEDYTVDKAATCTEDGSKSIHCSVCTATKDETIITALGHKWNSSYTVDKKATYAAKGSKSIHCSVCNAIKEGSSVSIPKLTVKATTLSSVIAAKKAFTVKWKKGSKITGYQIQYALNSKFTKGAKKVTITKSGTVSKKITKLKAKKKYYVRVRTYKKVSGKTYYSKWSKYKYVTTK